MSSPNGAALPATIMNVTDVSVAFGGVRALDGVSLEVRSGEIRGIIGPNGAGKTTLIDAITGFERLGGGSITYLEKEIGGWTPQRRSRAGVSRTFQGMDLFHDLTVEANLRVAYRRRLASGNDLKFEEVTAQCHLDGLLDFEVQELSHGEQRMVSLARAMALNPRVLILDEPAVGMDASMVGRLVDVVRTWGRRCAVVIIEHDISLIREVCDSITALHLGRVLMEGAPEAVLGSKEVQDVYLGGPGE